MITILISLYIFFVVLSIVSGIVCTKYNERQDLTVKNFLWLIFFSFIPLVQFAMPAFCLEAVIKSSSVQRFLDKPIIRAAKVSDDKTKNPPRMG